MSSTEALATDDPQIVALVTRAMRRDQTAFGELYDRYLDHVFRYMYYRTAHRSDAEDLTEQVFLQVWAAIERFRWQGKPFLAWVYTVAHNVLIDWRRRSAVVGSLDDDERALELESPGAAQAITRWIDADLLANAISRLTSDQQQVITLKFIDGLETAEVARFMDKREGTVRALQLRALQSLRRQLEQSGAGLAA